MSDSSPSVSLEQLQEQVACLQRQLIEAQRASALGELVGTTTHEFNNILMTVMNYAKLGLRHQDQAARDRAFTKILQASERAAEITRSVLGMARNRQPNFEPTQVAELIREAMLLLEKEMQKYRIAVELDIHEVPKIPVIANQIQQVLLNLLINARQAMPNGGRLVIRLVQDAKTQTVDLIVRDFGVGIPAESLKRIFDSYYTTKCGPDATGKGGTGLGLAACRNIIQAHHGKIRVESTIGKGTCFTVKLPLHRAELSEVPLAVAVLDRQSSPSLPIESGH